MGRVAVLLAMDRTTLTAALKPLERRGLVTVTIDPADRRQRRLALTQRGRRRLAAAVPIWDREHTAIDALFGVEGPKHLHAIFARWCVTCTAEAPAMEFNGRALKC